MEILEGIVALGVILGPLALMVGLPISLYGMRNGQQRKMKELEIRELEAKARLMEAEARAALPSFVDAADPEAVAAYKRAREEVNGRVKVL